MTKAGSPVSDETKEPGLLVRAASQPTSRCNRVQQSPADPQPPCNTMLSEHRDLGAAEPATRWNGPRSQTKSGHITRDKDHYRVLLDGSLMGASASIEGRAEWHATIDRPAPPGL